MLCLIWAEFMLPKDAVTCRTTLFKNISTTSEIKGNVNEVKELIEKVKLLFWAGFSQKLISLNCVQKDGWGTQSIPYTNLVTTGRIKSPAWVQAGTLKLDNFHNVALLYCRLDIQDNHFHWTANGNDFQSPQIWSRCTSITCRLKAFCPFILLLISSQSHSVSFPSRAFSSPKLEIQNYFCIYFIM